MSEFVTCRWILCQDVLRDGPACVALWSLHPLVVKSDGAEYRFSQSRLLYLKSNVEAVEVQESRRLN